MLITPFVPCKAGGIQRRAPSPRISLFPLRIHAKSTSLGTNEYPKDRPGSGKSEDPVKIALELANSAASDAERQVAYVQDLPDAGASSSKPLPLPPNQYIYISSHTHDA